MHHRNVGEVMCKVSLCRPPVKHTRAEPQTSLKTVQKTDNSAMILQAMTYLTL